VTNDLRRSTIAFTSVAGAFALLALAGILVLDRPLAIWAGGQPRGDTIWRSGTELLDFVFQKQRSNFAVGTVLLLLGGLLLILWRTRSKGWMLLYVGAVQFATTAVALLVRPVLGRLPPNEAMANPGAADSWLVGGQAFPADHVAFYAGLFFPLMLILPRWTFLFAIPPLFVAAGGVLSNQHYLSDVSASMALAAVVTGGLAFILGRAEG
jgi:membrane-associated phospholipid phosphatase